MLRFNDYIEIYKRVKYFDSVERFILERDWQDWMDGMTADQITDLMGKIHKISRKGIEGMLAVEGCKLTVFCKKYLLPYNTVQKWRSGESEPPEYTLMLLGWAVISE